MNFLSFENLQKYENEFSNLFNNLTKKQCYEDVDYIPQKYKKEKVNALIPITVNDFRFLPILMKQLDFICGKVVFIYSDYLFNQKEQDKQKLQKIFELPKKLGLTSTFEFVKYEIDFNVNEFFVSEYKNSPKRYWINKARMDGFDYIDKNAKWVLLIDSDEIPDSCEFLKWADTINWDDIESKDIFTLNFDNYVYFWKNCFVKYETENSIVLLNEKVFRNRKKYEPLFLNEFERTVFYRFIPENYCKMNIKFNNKCLFHHYSWVRTLEEMKSKVLNWGHSDDHLFVELNYNDGSREKERKVSINYMYANYFAHKFIENTEFKNDINKQKLNYFEQIINKYKNIKKIIKLYPENFNTYIEGVLKWFENPTIENNFMNYKCYQEPDPRFYVDYLYEDFE
jgi:hypothetical protein